MFSCEFCKFLRTQNTFSTEHLWALASLNKLKCIWHNFTVYVPYFKQQDYVYIGYGKFTLYASYFKQQEHVYIGYGDQIFEFFQLTERRPRLTCFSSYIMYKRKKVCEYLPVFQLSLT